MKKEFNTYLDTIRTGEVIKKRVESILEFYKNTYPEDIEDIFISDIIESGNGRIFQNLWFFSKSYAMEAKDFVSNKDDFDNMVIRQNVAYWRVVKENYDFKETTGKSRLSIHFQAKSAVTGDLQASKENCDYLKNIFVKHISPNLSA